MGSVQDWCFRYSRKYFCILHCFSELAKRSSEDNTGEDNIFYRNFFNSIKRGHAMAGIEAYPVSHPLERFASKGSKRKLALPVQPKEPLSVSTVQAIAAHLVLPLALRFPILGFFFAFTRLGI